MSDSFIVVIPSRPDFTPTPDCINAAVERLRAWLPDADDISAELSDGIKFRDAGANFESAACPECGADITDSFGEVLGADFDGTGFKLNTHEMPCCGASLSPDRICFTPPQGFSRFQISVLNPGAAQVGEAGLAELGSLLGTPVSVVLRHL